MAVVPYNSDVLCAHKTRLQLMYTDVQQLKMVQMVSRSQFFCDLYLLCLMRLLCLRKKKLAVSLLKIDDAVDVSYIFKRRMIDGKEVSSYNK